MAQVKNIRPLFANKLKDLDSEWVEHTDAFAVDDIGRHGFDKSFHIDFYSMNMSTLSHTTTRDTLTLTVTLNRKGFRGPQEAADDLFDFANLYRTEMMKPQDYVVPYIHILKIVGSSLQIKGIDTNDNSLEAVLTFNIDLVFGTNNLDY